MKQLLIKNRANNRTYHTCSTYGQASRWIANELTKCDGPIASGVKDGTINLFDFYVEEQEQDLITTYEQALKELNVHVTTTYPEDHAVNYLLQILVICEAWKTAYDTDCGDGELCYISSWEYDSKTKRYRSATPQMASQVLIQQAPARNIAVDFAYGIRFTFNRRELAERFSQTFEELFNKLMKSAHQRYQNQ